MLHLICNGPHLKIFLELCMRTDFCKANHFPVDFHSVIKACSYFLLISLSANYSSKQGMGSPEAHVSTGTLPWSGAQGRYRMQHIFVFSTCIKKKPRRAGVCANRCHPQADSCFAWLWYPSGELLICWQNSINKGLLIIIMLSIWVLVGGNTKEMWLCSWYQGA